MAAPNRLHNGRPYRRARAVMFALYGRTCHLCGHGGATDADLIVPFAVNPNQRVDPRNYRPAHGVRGCPTCGRRCNQERGTRPVGEVWTPGIEW
jgi:hypothetical protein